MVFMGRSSRMWCQQIAPMWCVYVRNDYAEALLKHGGCFNLLQFGFGSWWAVEGPERDNAEAALRGLAVRIQ